MTCKHKRGDWIEECGFWLCADCFTRLDGRPRIYGTATGIVTGDRNGSTRQAIIWQAEIATADGVKLNDYLRAMTRRFMQRTRPQIEKEQAYEHAIGVLNGLLSLGDSYGDPAYDWTHEGAREMADEEMAYWDLAEGGN